MNKHGYNLKKIKQLRELNSLLLTDMAQLLNITLAGYSKKENGERKFTISEAKVLSELFGLPIEVIFFNDKSNQNVNTSIS